MTALRPSLRWVAIVLMGAGVSAPADAQPTPTPAPLVEVPWEKLSNTDPGPAGSHVLGLQPGKWRHAETATYILHFRRATEARKVARELDENMAFVARLLGTPPAAHARKAHAFIFEDRDDWRAFLIVSGLPEWYGSCAIGEDLFLDVRRESGGNRFNYSTLAHEATHAVVARLYPGRRWPLWLNEGFAEYVSGAGIADRRNQTARRHQAALPLGNLTFAQLEALDAYPADRSEIPRLYQSSERVVRFLIDAFPPDRFPQFVDAMLDGLGFEASIWRVYGDQFKSWPELLRKFDRTKS